MVENGPEAVEQNSTTRTPDKGNGAGTEEVMERKEPVRGKEKGVVLARCGAHPAA